MTTPMSKETFARAFLSRYMALSDEAKYDVLTCLFLAPKDAERACRTDQRLEDTTEFVEWAETLAELLFPEKIGELHEGPLPPFGSDD